MTNSSNFFYDIRDWLLSEPDFAEVLDYTPQASGYKPFFPAQQFPESTPPYIIYSTFVNVNAERYFLRDGEVHLAFFFKSVDDSQKAVNVMLDMCTRGDDSARELNAWLAYEERDSDFIYHSITLPRVGQIEPTEERGGAHSNALLLEVLYAPKILTSQRRIDRRGLRIV